MVSSFGFRVSGRKQGKRAEGIERSLGEFGGTSNARDSCEGGLFDSTLQPT
jgi:hypothetical protein